MTPSDTAFQRAIELLSRSEPVVMPTESVYGLAADAFSDKAVRKIYDVKDRPSFNPLIVHVATLEQAKTIGHFNEAAEKAAKAFWDLNNSPRPLTLIVKKRGEAPLSPLVTAGLDTVGIRLPSHPVAHELLKRYKNPLAAPSANKSNHISPTTSDHVRKSLGDQCPFILEGGDSDSGLESTILDCTTDIPTILRHGPLTKEVLEASLGCDIQNGTHDSSIKAPGMLKKHYSPHLPLFKKGENIPAHYQKAAYITFGPIKPGTDETVNLSPTGNLEEAAKNLYSALYYCDDPTHYDCIVIDPIPSTGIGAAINDKVNRAIAK